MAVPVRKRRLLIVREPGSYIHAGTAKTFMEIFGEMQIIDHEEVNDCKVDSDTTVLLEGGTDICTSYYKEPKGRFTQQPDRLRDAHESALFHRGWKVGATFIGICRGAQFLCALSGGSLIQHVHNHMACSHGINTYDGKWMRAAGDHHQMMFPWTLRDSYWKMLAWAEADRSPRYWDGFNAEMKNLPETFKEPEVVWFPQTRALAIQPHPEWMENTDEFPTWCRNLVREHIFEDVVA
jgi:gamma-glutamyl-gamma-aminobutyrate hydrolase PuuD